MSRFLWALCVAAVCCTPAHASSHLSADPQVTHARSLIHAGRHLDALIVLRPLANQSREDITDIRFLIGLSAITEAQRISSTDSDLRDELLIEAITALRAILLDRPALVRVRLELARAFFMKGDDALSRRHFEIVLGGDPPAAMAVNIRRFLHAIRARRKWSGYLTVNVEQNDNINSGAETETIYLFGLPFTLNEESRPRNETGLSLSTGADYQTPLAKRWRWRSGVDVARSEYAGHDLDQTYLQLRTGPRYLVSRRSEVGLQASAGRRWVARDTYGNESSLRLTARHQASAKINGNARVARQENHRRIAEDSAETEYAVGASYLFSPLVQGNLNWSRVRESFAGGEQLRTRRITAGLGVILSGGWTLGGNHEWSRHRHTRPAPLSTAPRLDRKRTARLFILNRGITWFGFSPQLVLTRERQQSNSALDEYKRNRADLRFVRQF